MLEPGCLLRHMSRFRYMMHVAARSTWLKVEKAGALCRASLMRCFSHLVPTVGRLSYRQWETTDCAGICLCESAADWKTKESLSRGEPSIDGLLEGSTVERPRGKHAFFGEESPTETSAESQGPPAGSSADSRGPSAEASADSRGPSSLRDLCRETPPLARCRACTG